MANPQSPELRRSGRTPALSPDNAATRIGAADAPTTGGPEGPVPPDNRPGHHPGRDQDRPDPADFVERTHQLAVAARQEAGDDRQDDDHPGDDAPGSDGRRGGPGHAGRAGGPGTRLTPSTVSTDRGDAEPSVAAAAADVGRVVVERAGAGRVVSTVLGWGLVPAARARVVAGRSLRRVADALDPAPPHGGPADRGR